MLFVLPWVSIYFICNTPPAAAACCFGLFGRPTPNNCRYTEEEPSPEALAYLAKMSDALRTLYSPPRVLELPAGAPSCSADLVSIGSSLLKAGAVYAPEQPQPAFSCFPQGREEGAPSCGGGGRDGGGGGVGGVGGVGGGATAAAVSKEGRVICEEDEEEEEEELTRAVAEHLLQLERRAAGSENAGAALPQGDGESSGATAAAPAAAAVVVAPSGDGGDRDCRGMIRHGANASGATAAGGGGNQHCQGGGAYSEKVLSAKVASCLSALNTSRKELDVFSEELEQAHIQVQQMVFLIVYRVPF